MNTLELALTKQLTTSADFNAFISAYNENYTIQDDELLAAFDKGNSWTVIVRDFNEDTFLVCQYFKGGDWAGCPLAEVETFTEALTFASK